MTTENSRYWRAGWGPPKSWWTSVRVRGEMPEEVHCRQIDKVVFLHVDSVQHRPSLDGVFDGEWIAYDHLVQLAGHRAVLTLNLQCKYCNFSCHINVSG